MLLDPEATTKRSSAPPFVVSVYLALVRNLRLNNLTFAGGHGAALVLVMRRALEPSDNRATVKSRRKRRKRLVPAVASLVAETVFNSRAPDETQTRLIFAKCPNQQNDLVNVCSADSSSYEDLMETIIMKRLFDSTKQNIAHGVNARPATGSKRKIKRERAFEIREAWDDSDYSVVIKSFTEEGNRLALVSHLSADLFDLERTVVRQLREPHEYSSEEENIREVVLEHLLEWDSRLSLMATILENASRRAWELLDHAENGNPLL